MTKVNQFNLLPLQSVFTANLAKGFRVYMPTEGAADSGADDDPKTGDDFDESLIPADKKEAYEKFKQTLIDKGVNIGVGRTKGQSDKASEKAITEWLKGQGLSKDDLETAKGLLSKKGSLDKLLEVYGTTDIDEVLKMIEAAEQEEMTEAEKLLANLQKAEQREKDLKEQIEAIKHGHSSKEGEFSKRELKLLAAIEDLTVNKTLRDLATSLDVLDPDDVVPRLRNLIKLEESDDGFEPFVIDDKGNKKFDGNGNPVSIKSLVEDFVTKRPHLVKSNLQGGPGGGGPKNPISGIKPTGTSPFTKEQLKDPKFVADNMKAINEAVRKGQITL